MAIIKTLLDRPFSRMTFGHAPRTVRQIARMTRRQTQSPSLWVWMSNLSMLWRAITLFSLCSQHPSSPTGRLVGESEFGYIFDGRLNESFRLVNQLLARNLQVIRVDEAIEVGDTQFPPGAFVIPAESKEALEGFTLDSGVTFYALEQELSVPRHEVQQSRVGMYQRYHGGNRMKVGRDWSLNSTDSPVRR